MNSQSNSDENVKHSDNLHSSSSLQVKGEKSAAKTTTTEGNIPSSHHRHHEKSKMKKPDMPIYVPRGRRLAADSELQKLGEEKIPDRGTQKLEPEPEKEHESEDFLFSQEENSSLGSSEQLLVIQNGDAGVVKEVKTKAQEKKKALKTVVNDSLSEDSRGQKKTKSGQKTNSRRKKNMIQTGINACTVSTESAEVFDDLTETGGISVTVASDISGANYGGDLSVSAGNSIEPGVGSLSTDCDSTETLIHSVATGYASGMSASPVTAGDSAVAITSDSIERNGDLDNSATSCIELVSTGDLLANENMANCLNVLSGPDGTTSTPLNVGLATSDEQSWDALFDDSGEALHPDVMNQLTEALGTVSVQKPQFDYLNYQPKEPEINEEEFEHLIEIYDFPASLQTVDLVMAFRDFQDKGFEIKWVDDTHAIGVFSGRTAARSAITTFHNPFIKVRPIQQAARQTKLKAKKCTEFLLPYKPRPVTVASVARLMVTKALGVSEPVSKEKREEERQKIKAAREQKRTTKRQKEDAWEGKIGKCAMDET